MKISKRKTQVKNKIKNNNIEIIEKREKKIAQLFRKPFFTSVIVFIATFVLTYLLTILLAEALTLELAIKATGASVVVAICFVEFCLYLILFYDKRAYLARDMFLIFSLMYLCFMLCILVQKYISIYAMPIVALGVSVGLLVRRRIGLLASTLLGFSIIVVSIASGLNLTDIINLILAVVLSTISSFGMIFLTRKNETRFRLLWGTLLFSIILFPLSMVASFIVVKEPIDLARNALFKLVGDLLGIAIFTTIMPIVESLFGVWTNYKLAEYSSFDQPLLRQLIKDAPGTFQHSLAVGNMAELCALAINENPYQARIGGYYHDIGKMNHPEFFIENQVDGFNPHNELIPEISVKMIAKHTYDGYHMLKDAGLPEEIAKIAYEHHGTSKILYFYNKAQSITEGDLDSAPYRYPGPIPTSKLSAIIMLCDIVEATVRVRPMTTQELRAYIRKVIAEKIEEGQFVNCDITLKELEIIGKTIESVIPAINHKRIDYSVKL